MISSPRRTSTSMSGALPRTGGEGFEMVDVQRQLLGDLMLQHGRDFGVDIGVLVMEHSRRYEDAGACGTEAMNRDLQGQEGHVDDIRIRGLRGRGRLGPPVMIGSS